MADKPDTLVQIRDWGGQNSNASPHVISDNESQIQVNCGDVAAGRLDVRSGLRVLTFDN